MTTEQSVSEWLGQREDTHHARTCHSVTQYRLNMGRRKQIVPKKSDNLEDQDPSKATQNDEGWQLLILRISFCVHHLSLSEYVQL